MRANSITTTSSEDIPAWPELKNILTSESTWRSRLPSSARHIQWPEPELSIGLPCCSLGRHRCWEAIGPARVISRAIFRATKDLLDQHSEYLHETENVPFSIMFGLYMVGRHEKAANPTLLLSCEPKKPRQRALKLVRESGILQEYPGVLLAESSHAPTALDHVRLLGSLNAVDGELVFFSPPTQHNSCGRSIFVLESYDPDNFVFTSICQKATIGGFVRLRNSEHDDVYCGLTVAHAFEDEVKSPAASTDVEFAFDEQDNSDEGDYDDYETESNFEYCSSKGELEPRSHLAEQASKPTSFLHMPIADQVYQESLLEGGYGIGSQIATSLDGEHHGLDWALIEIQKPHNEPANVISVDKLTGKCLIHVERIVPTISENANVLVLTSSGVRTGVLSGSSTFFKSPHGCSFEEVFTVRVDGAINRGDSGCWVINPEKGDLYGHIIAGCTQSGVGYLVPAHRIFDDIQWQLGGTVELAAMNKISNTTTSSGNNQTAVFSGIGIDQVLTPLGMNQDAEEMIKLFDIQETVFAEMAIETDRWYQALITNPSNLKPYIKKPTPYSWHDISDKAKYDYIVLICSRGSAETQPVWDMGFLPQGECPNWIAKWFLYRRFKLAETSQEKRFSNVNPKDSDYMFVPRTENSRRIVTRQRPVPSSSHVDNRRKRESNYNAPESLAERGEMRVEFNSMTLAVPSSSRVGNRSKRERSSNALESLVTRGKRCDDFNSTMSMSEQDSLEEANVAK